MTVTYLQHLHKRLEQSNSAEVPVRRKEEITIRPADSSCEGLKVTLVPTRLETGEIVFLVPSQNVKEQLKVESENVWRPW